MIVYMTGASGFVGSNLLNHLTILGIKCVPLYSSIGNPHASSESQSISDFISGGGLSVTTDERKVFVHAGWGGVLSKSRNSIEQYDNVSTSIKLFKVALERGFSQFLSIGSQAEYSNSTDVLTEMTMLLPETDYGIAKSITYNSMTDLQKYYGKEILTHARIFDVYGLGDKPEWLLPSLIAALKENKNFELSSCQQFWNFIHISDLTCAIIDLLKIEPSGAINVCSDENLPLRSFIEIVANEVNGNGDLLKFGKKDHHSKSRNISGSNKKLKTLTNWQQKISFKDGIKAMLSGKGNYESYS